MSQTINLTLLPGNNMLPSQFNKVNGKQNYKINQRINKRIKFLLNANVSFSSHKQCTIQLPNVYAFNTTIRSIANFAVLQKCFEMWISSIWIYPLQTQIVFLAKICYKRINYHNKVNARTESSYFIRVLQLFENVEVLNHCKLFNVIRALCVCEYVTKEQIITTKLMPAPNQVILFEYCNCSRMWKF
eukprot:TRINITY_DN17643_c0_g2_i3.p1 TRINITY_DN17643_c0_g2~~TRINITY_DN17643_c0_g2_i3.p1  ORF type:complete len:187 (+),score=-4.15 TRINITY_DN17643_c0_g2_i3:643-1203(+)